MDNELAIDLTKNPTFHGRSKHFKIPYHYVKTCVQEGEVEVRHISTARTYSLGREKFSYFHDLIVEFEIKGENVGDDLITNS